MEDNGYAPFPTACKAVVLPINTNPPNYENYTKKLSYLS